jgi:hypothetical protein
LHNTPSNGKAQTLYAISAGVRSTRSEDGGIVLDVQHGQIFRLNPVGAVILELLGEGCAQTEIATQIARQYRISEESAAVDVREFLESLEEHKLVRTQREDEVL